MTIRYIKELERFPEAYRRTLVDVIESLARDPYSGSIRKLKGEKNSWRRRVGNYRIFYDLYPERRLVHITHVERRASKTY